MCTCRTPLVDRYSHCYCLATDAPAVAFHAATAVGDEQQQVSGLDWVLPYQATSLLPQNMPVVSHNLKPERLQQRRTALNRWVIYPPPLPPYSGPVQEDADGRVFYQKLPNGMPIHT